MIAWIVALLTGFAGLLVLFAPFWLSGALSEQESNNVGCSGESPEAQVPQILWIWRR